MNLPLAGTRILSSEQYGAGPYGTMFLAQLGAEVIKIEPPAKNGKGGGDSARATGPFYRGENDSLFYQTFNLNKRSLTLDLRTDAGQRVLHRLWIVHWGQVLEQLSAEGGGSREQLDRIAACMEQLKLHKAAAAV